MIVPRDYQEESAAAFIDCLLNYPEENPLVCLPTGTGKSLVIAIIIAWLFEMFKRCRILKLTHVETLIEQNAERLLDYWPTAPLGIHCEGLGHRATVNPCIFGSVKSVFNKLGEFKPVNLILIDEVHLLSPAAESMYQLVIAHFKKLNPHLQVGGLTATGYRNKQGLITNGGLLTKNVYDLTDIAGFKRLVDAGYMARLIGKPMETALDVSGVAVVGGEFVESQLQKAVNKYEITYQAVRETTNYLHGRNSMLAFAAGIEHSESIATMFQKFNIPVEALHSKLPKAEQRRRYAAFKAGELFGLSSANKLTTGIDHPPIDLIVDLQPTLSPSKHVQKLGRGTRPFECEWYKKENCLTLDFARNVMNNGPINAPRIPNPPGKKRTGTMPVKLCEECGFYNHTLATHCEACGFEFHREVKLLSQASTASPMIDDASQSPWAPQEEAEYHWFDVNQVFYSKHKGNGKAPCMKVNYACGLRSFIQWVHFEGHGLAKHKSHEWWRQRTTLELPLNTDAAIKQITNFRVPTKIKVHTNTRYPEVVDCEF